MSDIPMPPEDSAHMSVPPRAMPPGMHRRLPRITSRSVLLLVLAIVVALCAVLDQHATTPSALSSSKPIGAAPASAVSSAWYCPLMTGDGAVTVLNPQAQALTGTVSFAGSNGEAANVAVNVAPRARQTLSSPFPNSAVGALVKLSGGGASVTQLARTQQGTTTTPCSSDASQHWYFADGSTESGATLLLGLYNPFTDDALADVTFQTSEGDALPEAFQGVQIPAGKMVLLNVSDNVRRRDYVATQVTLRNGRLAAAQLQTGLIGGRVVAGYNVGVPALSLDQYVPNIETYDGDHSVLSIYNPNDVESHIRIENILDKTKGTALPFDLRVPADGRVTVVFDAEARIPKNVSLAAHVEVQNGVPVATQLTTTADKPLSFTGGSFLSPPAQPAKQVMFATGSVVDGSDSWIYVLNTSKSVANVRMTLTGDGNASTQTPVKVQPGDRYVFHVNDLSPNATASVVVDSDQNIVASRATSIRGGTGYSTEPAVPVRQ